MSSLHSTKGGSTKTKSKGKSKNKAKGSDSGKDATIQRAKKANRLRVTNVLLSVFALLLSFLVEGIDDLGYALTPGLNQLIVGVSLACVLVAVLLTHVLVGKQYNIRWQLWQPFVGGWKFVTLQAISWTMLAVSLLITGLALHPAHLHRGTYATAGTLAFLSEVLMTCSLPLFESPATTDEKVPSIQLRWNDVGTINIIVAALSLVLSVFLDNLRDLPIYTSQLHNILGTVSVLCILNAAILTHVLVGKMRHGAYWKSWNPFLFGGWRFAALQAVSWVFLSVAVIVGAWSLKYTAVEGTLTFTGALGFLSVLFMVTSIQAYVVPVATDTVLLTTPTSEMNLFQTYLVNFATLVETARMFLVTTLLFNVFYGPVMLVLSFLLPLILTPVWIGASITCLAVATYVAASYLPRPEITGAHDRTKVRESFILRDVVKYFKGDVVKTAELDSTKQYIYGFHPHGILPMASMWAHNSDTWAKLFNTPKRSAVTLIASHLFRLPLTRDILLASGAREVSRIAFETAIKQGKSVFLVPGGMREMQFSDSLQDDITICTTHKGFIRMAIKHGIDLVPVYSFGETKIVDGAFPKLQKWCWKYIRMPFPLFIGIWGLPIPRRQAITVVVGGAIHVKQNPEPTQEEIEAIGKEYFDALRAVFDQHKAAYGHEKSNMVFDS